MCFYCTDNQFFNRYNICLFADIPSLGCCNRGMRNIYGDSNDCTSDFAMEKEQRSCDFFLGCGSVYFCGSSNCIVYSFLRNGVKGNEKD